MMHPKDCEQCGRPCQLLQPKSNPGASEWYCGDCHKSHDVPGLTTSG